MSKKFPAVALAILSVVIAGYLLVYVEPRRDYLVELDFRRLSAMAERIDRQLATYRQVVANATKPPYFLPPPLELVASGPQSTAEEPWVTIEDRVTPTGRWFLFSANGTRARLRIDEIFRQAVEPNTFDKLILATQDGRVLYQEGRGDIHLTTLAGLGLTESDIKKLSQSTGLHDAEISGRAYKVFIRPCSTSRAPKPGQEPSEGWVIAALMRAPRFHLRSLQVSVNAIIAFIGVTLLTFLSLPFVKLLTIGEGARLRAIDGLLAGLCSVIGVSVLTLLLLDAFVYRKLEISADRQLAKVAASIHASFKEDLEDALKSLTKLREEARSGLAADGLTIAANQAMKGRTSFFWADERGNQVLRWTPQGVAHPLLPVGDRSYFRDALAEAYSLFRTESKSEAPRGFTIESIRSWTTGEGEVAIATKEEGTGVEVQERKPAVAVMITRMNSVHRPALPPGFGFAIIDSSGNVLFHSDPRRMLQENFLEEADSETLSALTSVKRPGFDRVLYMERQHKVYLEPIPELSWSVIVFRDMTLLRATNVQIITTALACLILYAALLLVLFILVYSSSSTRARWLWPAHSRRSSYSQLALFYAACLLVHVKMLQDGNPIFLLVTGMLFPLMYLFLAYIKVRFDEGISDGKQVGALLATITLLAISVAAGWPWQDAATLLIAVSASIAGGLFLFLPSVTRIFRRRPLASLRNTYWPAATLLLMVLTILPAASFFKFSCDLPIESYLKLEQLTLIQQSSLQKADAARASTESKIVFNLTIPPNNQREQGPHVPGLREAQEWIFPIYSDYSRKLARLAPDTLDEWPSAWVHRGGMLWLHHRAAPGQPSRHIGSQFLLLTPRGLDWLLLGLGVLILAAISAGLAWIMIHKLMLLDSGLPLWLNRHKISLGSSTGHLLYVSSIPDRLDLSGESSITLIDITETESEIEAGKYPGPFNGKRLIVVRGFEHRLEEHGFNWAKLRLLENLINKSGKRVVLLSGQNPYLCLASGLLVKREDESEREQEERQRWIHLLARFTLVDLVAQPENTQTLTERLRSLREQLAEKSGRRHLDFHAKSCLQLIEEECGASPTLQEIGLELIPELCLHEMSRSEVMQEIQARAEQYYSALWSSLRQDEKLVLLQLSEEGLVNPRSVAPLQRLIARGLVRREPAPLPMNESFRLFVIEESAKEEVREIEIQREKKSTWGQLRVPITATMVGCMFFFGFTQHEMLKTTLSLIGLTAGALPQVLQIIGYLSATKAPMPGR